MLLTYWLIPDLIHHASRRCLLFVYPGGKDPRDPALNGPNFVLAQVARDLILTQGWVLAFDEIQMVILLFLLKTCWFISSHILKLCPTF